MKTPCDTCIVYPTCAKTCIPMRHFKNKLNHDIEKMKRFIWSKNKNPRKRLKEKHRLHYNALIKDWNRACKQNDVVLDRRYALELINTRLWNVGKIR